MKTNSMYVMKSSETIWMGILSLDLNDSKKLMIVAQMRFKETYMLELNKFEIEKAVRIQFWWWMLHHAVLEKEWGDLWKNW